MSMSKCPVGRPFNLAGQNLDMSKNVQDVQMSKMSSGGRWASYLRDGFRWRSRLPLALRWRSR
jgi:hypothetical protein